MKCDNESLLFMIQDINETEKELREKIEKLNFAIGYLAYKDSDDISRQEDALNSVSIAPANDGPRKETNIDFSFSEKSALTNDGPRKKVDTEFSFEGTSAEDNSFKNRNKEYDFNFSNKIKDEKDNLNNSVVREGRREEINKMINGL